MASVLVALYDSHTTAEGVRTALVEDGFPTDRVQLTSCREPGTAGMIAAERATERFRKYFETLFDSEEHLRHARFLAARVRKGAATITVHPRGEREIGRAVELLERASPLLIDPEHLDDTRFEQAAAAHDRPYLLRVIQASDRGATDG